MNIDVYYQLDECLCISQRVIRLLEQDKEGFSALTQGELRENYRRNCDMMEEQLEKLKNQLLLLREKQLL